MMQGSTPPPTSAAGGGAAPSVTPPPPSVGKVVQQLPSLPAQLHNFHSVPLSQHSEPLPFPEIVPDDDESPAAAHLPPSAVAVEDTQHHQTSQQHDASSPAHHGVSRSPGHRLGHSVSPQPPQRHGEQRLGIAGAGESQSRFGASSSVFNASGASLSHFNLSVSAETVYSSPVAVSVSPSAHHRKQQQPDAPRLTSVNGIALDKEVGRGAFGVVYRAACEERYPRQLLAVKAIPRAKVGVTVATELVTSTDGERLAVPLPVEVRVMAELPSSPYIVPVLEVIDDPKATHLFVVMPFVEGARAGECYAARDSRTGEGIFACEQLTETELRRVAIDCSKALVHLRENGVVHGDIKPENVMVTRTPLAGVSGKRVVLSDFGTARMKSIDDPNSHALGGSRISPRLDVGATRSPAHSQHLSPAHSQHLSPAHMSKSFAGSPVAMCLANRSTSNANNSQSRSPSTSVMRVCIAPPVMELPAPVAEQARLASSSGAGASPQSVSVASQESRGGSSVNMSPSLAASAAVPSEPPKKKERRSRGTPAFLPPELLRDRDAEPTPESDIWALGVTLYSLRYGVLPFFGTTVAALSSVIVHGDGVRFPNTRPYDSSDAAERRWRRLIKAMLNPEPKERATADDVLISRAVATCSANESRT